MKDIKFRAWDHDENKMYTRAYQKWLHVLLCDDDRGENEGRGKPVKRIAYNRCTLLESTGLIDKNRREIYEGDVVRVRCAERVFEDVVGAVPDSFGSGKAHPLKPLFLRHGVSGNPDDLEIEVLGNEYENPGLAEKLNR